MRRRLFKRRLKAQETIGLLIIAVVCIAAVLFRTAERVDEMGIGEASLFVGGIAGALLLGLALFRLARKNRRAYLRSRRFRPFNSAELSELIAMGPFEFEKYVGHMYEGYGYTVFVTPGVGDHGIDIIMKKDGKRYAVQVKKYGINHPVEEREVRDFYGSYAGAGYTGGGYFVTTSGFTREARAWVGKRPLTLIDGKALLSHMRESGVLPWYRQLLSSALQSPITLRKSAPPPYMPPKENTPKRFWKNL